MPAIFTIGSVKSLVIAPDECLLCNDVVPLGLDYCDHCAGKVRDCVAGRVCPVCTSPLSEQEVEAGLCLCGAALSHGRPIRMSK